MQRQLCLTCNNDANEVVIVTGEVGRGAYLFVTQMLFNWYAFCLGNVKHAYSERSYKKRGVRRQPVRQ